MAEAADYSAPASLDFGCLGLPVGLDPEAMECYPGS